MIEIIIIIAVWWIFVLPIIEKIGRDRQEKRDKEHPESEFYKNQSSKFHKAQMARYEELLEEEQTARDERELQNEQMKASHERYKDKLKRTGKKNLFEGLGKPVESSFKNSKLSKRNLMDDIVKPSDNT